MLLSVQQCLVAPKPIKASSRSLSRLRFGGIDNTLKPGRLDWMLSKKPYRVSPRRFAEVVDEYKKNRFDVVPVAVVRAIEKETGQRRDIVVAREDNKNERYVLYALEPQYLYLQDLGDMELSWDEKNPLYLSHINTELGNKKFYGLGTLLHQIAVERSFESGLHGQVTLNSAAKALAFHYKCGFSAGFRNAPDALMNAELERRIRIAEDKKRLDPSLSEAVNTEDLGQHRMVLRAPQIEEWKRIICQSPILLKCPEEIIGPVSTARKLDTSV